MKRRRIGCWLLLIAAALAAVLAHAGGTWFLRREVTAQLAALNGAPVTVGRVGLGIRRHQAHDVRLLQPAGGTWIEIDRVLIELPVWRVILGHVHADRLEVVGGLVRLQVDEQGNLLTRWPALGADLELPGDTLAVRDARLEIHRPSAQPVVADGIQADVQARDDVILVAGRVADALGAAWTFEARTDPAQVQTTGAVQSHALRITTRQLAEQELLPTGVPDGLSAELVGDVGLRFRHAAEEPLTSSLAIAIRSLDVHYDPLAWDLRGATGSIVIDDGVAALDNVSGSTWGGRLALSGQTSLEPATRDGRIDARLESVTLPEQLLPEAIADVRPGTCSAEATVRWREGPGGVEITGNASGAVRDASLEGIALDPMPWQLRFAAPWNDRLGPIDGEARVEFSAPHIELDSVLGRRDIDSDEIAGSASLSGVLTVPLATATDPETYTANGQFESSELNLQGVTLHDLRASYALADGQLRAGDLQCAVANQGQVSGQLEVGLLPPETLAAQIEFSRVPIATLAQFADEANAGITGTSSGRFQASVAVDRLTDLEAWTASGDVASAAVQRDDLQLTDLALRAQLSRGRLRLTEGTAAWNGSRVDVRGEADLLASHSFSGQFTVGGLDLGAIFQHAAYSPPVPVSGRLAVQGDVQGRWKPLTWSARGSGRLLEFSLAEQHVKRAQFRWHADPAGLDVDRATADLMGGRVEVTAHIPVDAEGTSRVLGTFDELDTAAMQPLLPTRTVVLSGSASGDVQLTNLESTEHRRCELRFRGLGAAVENVPVSGIHGTLTYQAGRTDVQLAGDVLGGTIGFLGRSPASGIARDDVRWDGRVQLQDVQLAEIWPLFPAADRWRRMAGVAESEMTLQLVGESLSPRAAGRLRLRDLRWENKELTPLAEAALDLRGRELQVADLSCRAVGGTWTGQLTVRTGTPAVGAFRIGVERVSLDRLVTLLGGPSRRLKGAVDAAVAGRIGPEWDGRALLRLTNGTLAGVPVSTAPAPLDWAIEPTSGRTRARIRVPSARVAGGRVRGEAELRWAGRLGLEAEVDFDSLAVQPLARALPLVNDGLQGELKGRCQIEGARVRSVDDLSGSFEATLARSQALTLPVLRALTSSLGVGSPSSTMFSQTAAQGRFGKGVIHLDRMTMVAENVQMFITGRMSRQGNLDLNVTADVPQITVVGIAAGLLRPLDLLRRRLLFFHVHGSIRSPIVQPRTAEFLQQEIILFFMPFVVTP